MKKINLITVLTTACMLSATVSILGVNNYAFAAIGAGKDALLEEDEGWVTHTELGKMDIRDVLTISSLFPEGTKIHGIKFSNSGYRGDIHFTHILPDGSTENRVYTMIRNKRHYYLRREEWQLRRWKVTDTTGTTLDNRSRVHPKHRFIITKSVTEGIKPDRTTRGSSSSSRGGSKRTSASQGVGRTGDAFFGGSQQQQSSANLGSERASGSQGVERTGEL